MPNVIESYLVSLGFSVSQPELRKFQDGMKAAADAVERNTSGIVGSVFKWQAALVSGLAAVAGAAIGLGDHVAEQDQKFRLLGLRFLMTTESAKKMQIGLDALGASLSEVAWDPELHARFLTLVDDQKKLEDQLGTDFSQQMKSIRDLRFEFTRLQVAGQYIGMKVVSDIFKSFGLTIEDVMLKLRSLSSWVQEHLPQISGVIADTLVPILKDAWSVLKLIAVAMKEAAVAFTNLTGLILGDSSIEGATFKIENFGKALRDISKFARYFVEVFAYAFEEVAQLITAATLLISGKTKEAAEEFHAAMATDKIGLQRLLAGKSGDPQNEGQPRLAQSGPLAPVVVEAARRVGVDPRIALGVATQESGVRQNRADGSPMTSSSGALGVMQLMPGTAKGLGVNPLNANENIRGGVQYLAQLYAKYKDWRLALAAYNSGPGNVDSALRHHTQLSPEVQKYVNDVMSLSSRVDVGQDAAASADRPSIFGSNAGMDDYASRAAAESRGAAKGEDHSGDVAQSLTVGDVSVYVTQSNASPREIGHETQKGITELLRRQTQRDLAQLSPAY